MFGARVFVVALDHQPIVVLLVGLAVHPDEMPAPAQLFAFQFEFEMALGQPLVRIADRLPLAAVPHNDRTAAILALGYRALEIAVVERVVLDMDGEALFARHEARALGHRPAFQNAVQFQPEVVMQPPRVMLLHDKAGALELRLTAPGL